jgi:hypothetical protein
MGLSRSEAKIKPSKITKIICLKYQAAIKANKIIKSRKMLCQEISISCVVLNIDLKIRK